MGKIGRREEGGLPTVSLVTLSPAKQEEGI